MKIHNYSFDKIQLKLEWPLLKKPMIPNSPKNFLKQHPSTNFKSKTQIKLKTFHQHFKRKWTKTLNSILREAFKSFKTSHRRKPQWWLTNMHCTATKWNFHIPSFSGYPQKKYEKIEFSFQSRIFCKTASAGA
jgi:hypothetical protein